MMHGQNHIKFLHVSFIKKVGIEVGYV